ncbi:MAG TPA: O-antigen ligase family protein [Vicinamibacterales bacterium]|nr:O-antigen ligase family protein [Vicinamibacterales bacterium]
MFAFGGAYQWTVVPLIAGSVALAALQRPRLFRPGARALDAAVTACLVVAGFQLVMLPAPVRLDISPALARVDGALRLDAPSDPRSGPRAPLAVDPTAGAEWLALAVGIVLYFWCARDALRYGSVRQVLRAVSICGGTAAAIALVQHTAAPRLIYLVWRPVSRSAQYPFGPFVNRNDMAAWMVMALPLSTGYMLARLDVRRRERRLDLESSFDATGVWLATAICAMAAVLVATLSRSGLTAGAAAAVSIALLARGRMERRGLAVLVAALALVALVGAAYANLGALMTRVGETLESGVGGRREIWRVSVTMIRDFWLAGVGVGSYERAMTVYQPPHDFAFNHAHNEYLQLAAEGGLLFCVPAACAIGAGVWGIARRMQRDRTPVYWIRAGAATALLAIGVQSIWETGLRMPANAVLFALCAAIALHEPGAG